MIIELTGIDGDKTFINTGCIIEFYRDNDETNIERHGGVDFLCKETPAQIQEMIMLDEFAKVALGGLCEWGEDIEDMTKGAY